MRTRPFRPLRLCLCLLLCSLAVLPAVRAAREPVTLLLDGEALPCGEESFIEDGVTYVPLAAFARRMGPCEVRWDGAAAHVSAPGLSLRAAPGEQWIEANGRLFYVPGSVRLIAGRTLVPLNALARVYGLELAWDGGARAVSIRTGRGALPVPGGEFYDDGTLYWLSRVISAESRGEALEGQIAVGNVVLNRIASGEFPDTLTEVIFQPGQFEPVANGTIRDEPYFLSVIAAKLCLDGARTAGDCLFFFAPALSPGTWIVNHRVYFTTIGCHRFYL